MKFWVKPVGHQSLDVIHRMGWPLTAKTLTNWVNRKQFTCSTIQLMTTKYFNCTRFYHLVWLEMSIRCAEFIFTITKVPSTATIFCISLKSNKPLILTGKIYVKLDSSSLEKKKRTKLNFAPFDVTPFFFCAKETEVSPQSDATNSKHEPDMHRIKCESLRILQFLCQFVFRREWIYNFSVGVTIAHGRQPNHSNSSCTNGHHAFFHIISFDSGSDFYFVCCRRRNMQRVCVENTATEKRTTKM